MTSGVNRISILTFHALQETRSPTAYPPAAFARALKNWRAAGWRTLSLNDAVRQLESRTPLPEKTFVLTFDDGYASVYRIAFPLLRELGMTATVFIAPGEGSERRGDLMSLPTLYGREMLTWGEIREMRAAGIDFGAHSLTHRNLTQLGDGTLEREIRESRAVIEDAAGGRVSFFAYPMGFYDARVQELARRHYAGCCSDRLGLANFKSDLYALERVETYYLRGAWAADALTRGWLPWYLELRKLPRRLRRVILPPPE